MYILYSPDGKKIKITENLNELIKESNNLPDSKIMSEDGNLVHVSQNNKVIYNKKYTGGEAIRLKNVRVYKKGSSVPFTIGNGIYYLYNGECINNKYAIVKERRYSNTNSKNIFGYVSKFDINFKK